MRKGRVRRSADEDLIMAAVELGFRRRARVQRGIAGARREVEAASVRSRGRKEIEVRTVRLSHAERRAVCAAVSDSSAA